MLSYNLFISLNIGFNYILLSGVPFLLELYILYFFFLLNLLLFIVDLVIRVNANNHITEAILGYYEISLPM